jgi:hypothetical protein
VGLTVGSEAADKEKALVSVGNRAKIPQFPNLWRKIRKENEK